MFNCYIFIDGFVTFHDFFYSSYFRTLSYSFLFAYDCFVSLSVVTLSCRCVFVHFLFAVFWTLDFLPECFNGCFSVLFFFFYISAGTPELK